MDRVKNTTTLDAAETARVYGLIVWATRQIARCHKAADHAATTVTPAPEPTPP